MGTIHVIDKTGVIPLLEGALKKAKTGELSDATVVLIIDGVVNTFMTQTNSKYEDAGILFDLMLERLNYWPEDDEDD